MGETKTPVLSPIPLEQAHLNLTHSRYFCAPALIMAAINDTCIPNWDISTPTWSPNSIYIVLFDRGEKAYTFHWALYLHQAANSGFKYHLVNTTNSTSWKFDPHAIEDVDNDGSILAALEIGCLEPMMHPHLLHRLEEISILDSKRFRERITCRVWLKEAIYALDDEGYISLSRTVDEIEERATLLAMQNKSLGRRTIAQIGDGEA
ncbi:uncharacterized protein N7506_012026 [Penicillium brevicompactum]|uniref:uncharacterized protein n=1 Tax=Penicillium brevicompactum TaxID=5074 RepID=UPI002541B518|nr:uncharacterized protein N7506_012026 [Penicillium brevicompactum]KAJ5319322.1 hypothetical protein N7506_012026 [Penicillium brevicompactum]